MSTTIDLYDILQVQPTAHPDVIAAAYRALARRYHPDSGGAERAMIALNHAWEVLKHPHRRAAYDKVRAGDSAELQAARTVMTRPAATPPPAAAPSRPFGSMRPPAPVGPGPRPASGPSGASILDFGRYDGWSLREVARTDPDYLEWLARTPIGRRYTGEIVTILRERAETTSLNERLNRTPAFARR